MPENLPSQRFYQIGPGAKFTEYVGLDEALRALREGAKVWFDFTKPSREILEKLSAPLGLHSLAIEDCVDEDEIPKMEEYQSNTFIIFNRFLYAERKLTVREVDFFLGKNFLVTVNVRDGDSAKYFDKLEESVRRDPTNVQKGPDFLLHVILDFIVDEKFDTIEGLQEELDHAEEAVLNNVSNFKPVLIIDLRKSLLLLRKSLFHEREILVKICRRDSPFVGEKALFHFRDIYDHLSRFYELTEFAREIMASLVEMYLSVINNQLNVAANRTNQVVRRLTLITTIFMPLTLIAGIGGMSEWSMMTGPENWRISYSLLILGMLVISGFTYLLLRVAERRERGAAKIRGVLK
jgi:magnesium transporter